MPKRLEWFVARRYLASRRKGRFLSLITIIAGAGIALGVMALITVIAVMTGLQQDLQAKILGSNPHVYVFSWGTGFRLGDWRDALARTRAAEGVVAAAPFMMTNAVVTAGEQFTQPGMLFGLDPASDQPPMTVIEEQIDDGTLALGPTAGLPGLLLGTRLAARLGVLTGDTVTMMTLDTYHDTPTGDIMPALALFEVTGTFETGMYEYDERNMYTDMAAVQNLLGLPPDTVSGIAVNVEDPWHADRVAASLNEHLGHGEFYLQDWMQLNRPLFSALKLEKLAMIVILFLIVLVAAFNIISTLIMVVTDKTREIGILKSMGMTDAMVLRVFMLQGLAIGLIGTAIGAVGGIVLSFLIGRYELIELPGDVYFIDTLPVSVDPLNMGAIVVASLLISLAATLYPAVQAARMAPVDAIRYE